MSSYNVLCKRCQQRPVLTEMYNMTTKLEAHNCIRFPSLNLRGQNRFQNTNAPLDVNLWTKRTSCTGHWPRQHWTLLDEQERLLHASRLHLISVPGHANALAAKWANPYSNVEKSGGYSNSKGTKSEILCPKSAYGYGSYVSSFLQIVYIQCLNNVLINLLFT